MVEVEKAAAPEKPKTEVKKPEVSEKKKKSKLNLIIIVVVQLFLAGGGFFVVTKFIKPDAAFRMATEDKEKRAAVEEGGETQIYLLEDLIVNPAGTKGSRYLSVSIGVEMLAEPHKKGGGQGDDNGYSPLDDKNPQLRDALINILSAKTIMQLTSVEEKEQIRQEILEKFRQILDPQVVHKIYFVDFVLQ